MENQRFFGETGLIRLVLSDLAVFLTARRDNVIGISSVTNKHHCGVLFLHLDLKWSQQIGINLSSGLLYNTLFVKCSWMKTANK